MMKTHTQTAAFQTLRETLNEERFIEFLHKAQTLLHTRFTHLSEAFTQRDWETVEQQTHKLKGTAVHFNNPQFNQLLDNIQKHTDTPSSQTMSVLQKQARETHESLQQAIGQCLEESTT